MNTFNYSPATGLLDTSAYPTQPTTEAAARQQFMDLFNQVKTFVNTDIINELATKPNKTTDFANSLSGNGWYKLPNGLILQWCSSSIAIGANANGNTSGSFPIAFPTACVFLGGSPVPSIDNNAVYMSGSSKTATTYSLTWHTTTAQTIICFVFAIGY